MVAAAGVLASIAVAKPPPGHGNPHQGSTTTGTTVTSTTGATTTTKGHGKSGDHGKGAKPGKVLVCHKTGNGHYVLVKVSAKSAPAKGKHGGDVLATNGTCPGPLQGHHGTTTGSTTTTTTTAATTTS
jgi:hypothetical protein